MKGEKGMDAIAQVSVNGRNRTYRSRRDPLNKVYLGIEHDPNTHLIRAYRAGDLRALNELFERNGGLIRTMAMDFYPGPFTVDELLQFSRFGYWKAIRRYDEAYGVRLNSYAVTVARSFLIMKVVRANSKKRRVQELLFWSFSYDSSTEKSGDDDRLFRPFGIDPSRDKQPNAEYLMLLRERLCGARKRMAVKMDERERFVVRRYFGFDDREGPWSFERIASHLDCSRANAQRICSNAVRKLHCSMDEFRALVYAERFLDSCGLKS